MTGTCCACVAANVAGCVTSPAAGCTSAQREGVTILHATETWTCGLPPGAAADLLLQTDTHRAIHCSWCIPEIPDWLARDCCTGQGKTRDDDRKHQAAEAHVWAASSHEAALPHRPSVALLDTRCPSVQAVRPRLRSLSSVRARKHSRGDARAAKCRPACACWVVQAHTLRSLCEEVPATGRL